jgi:DNA processing protein
VTAIDLTLEGARRGLALGGQPQDADEAVELERYALVVWSHLTEPGDGAAGRLVAGLGAVDALRTVMRAVPSGECGLTPDELAHGRRRWAPRLSSEAVETSLRIAARSGVRIVTRADAEWPGQLDDLAEHAPLCLWVRGDPSRLQRLDPAVALVGARAATSYGEHVALELSADLAGSGTPVVSGGAYGIDGAAHRAANAVGGLTVALLAGGADRAYPVGHTQLLGQIAETGAVVSEVPCGSAPTKWRFLQRNRLIAALTSATVVVEAGWRSGSLNTAGHAATLGRPVGAVPGPITSAASAGTHRLLREFGAQCITSAEDIRELLGIGTGSGIVSERTTGGGAGVSRPWTDDATRVRDALSTRVWRDVDDVARRAGMTRDDVAGILGVLDLDGSAIRSGTGWRKIGSADAG